MSERRRAALGTVLLLGSLALCLFPALPLSPAQRNAFTPSEIQAISLEALPAEHSGEIRVNSASAKELEQLPGVGAAYAERMVAERELNGPYYYPEDLEAVSGIGPQTLQKFRTMLDMRQKESGE